MQRNINRRMETITPVNDPQLKQELEETLLVYENDNYSAWDMQPDGNYIQRRPQKDQERRAAQEVFINSIGKKPLPKYKVS
jgi:polyphosphate kinase